MSVNTYLWPGETHIGFGAVAKAGDLSKQYGASHAFIVTDSGIVGAGLTQPVIAALEAAGVAHTVFDGIPGNPDVESVDRACAAYREAGADIVIGLGGGSPMDAAKGVRLQVGGPAGVSVGDYMLVRGDKARKPPASRDMPPMIAIPTTSGTGAEVTPWGVLTDHSIKQKSGIGGAYLLPTIALADPGLTLGMPPGLTAATGMDALSHLVEAYVSTNNNPLLDPLILQGIRLIGRSLRVATVQGGNRQARADMMSAAVLGGIAISSNWLGAAHSLAHQLSTFANMHHGVACAVMLPHQMAWSLIGAIERYADVAVALDPAAAEVALLRDRAELAVDMMHELNEDLGIAARLRDHGVTEDLLPTLSEYAARDLNWASNPRAVRPADLAEMFRMAF